MIFGIGTDIVAYPRIHRMNEQYGIRFAQRLLNETEISGYTSSTDPARFLMKRFAAKEAFAKAMGTGLRAEVALHRIYVEHDELGKPLLAFDNTLAQFMQQRGVTRHHLSISDEKDVAVAFVILEKD